MTYVAIKSIKRRTVKAQVCNLAVSKNENFLVNGVVVHNCRCGAVFTSIFELEQRRLVRDGRVVRYMPPGFHRAHPDPGFKVGAISAEFT